MIIKKLPIKVESKDEAESKAEDMLEAEEGYD